jgi:hypothetical protein
MASIAFCLLLAECHNDECHYAECRYAKCRYAECHYGPQLELYRLL